VWKGTTIESRNPTDPLHLVLNEVLRCFKYTLAAACVTVAIAAALSEVMREMGILTEGQIQKRAQQGSAAAHSFIGDHAEKVLEENARLDPYTNETLSRLIKSCVNARDERKTIQCWLALVVFVKEVARKDEEDTPANRAAKSARMKVIGRRYGVAYKAACGMPKSNHYPVYLHYIEVHMWRMPLMHGTNLAQYAVQGLEHLQKMGKKHGQHSNKLDAGAVSKTGRVTEKGKIQQMLGGELIAQAVKRFMAGPEHQGEGAKRVRTISTWSDD
jgi:hypothetical protein